MYQALFQNDYLWGVAFYGLGTIIINKGCAIHITTYLVPLTPSGIVISFLNNCLNKEVHLCSISVPFQIVLHIILYTMPLIAMQSIGLHVLLIILWSLYMSAFPVPSGFEPSCLGPVLLLWTERGIMIQFIEPLALGTLGQWNAFFLAQGSHLGFCIFQVFQSGVIQMTTEIKQ